MKELKQLENAIKNIDRNITQNDINLLVSCYDSVKWRLKNEFPEVFKKLYN